MPLASEPSGTPSVETYNRLHVACALFPYAAEMADRLALSGEHAGEELLDVDRDRRELHDRNGVTVRYHGHAVGEV